jgi:hypothetical protein
MAYPNKSADGSVTVETRWKPVIREADYLVDKPSHGSSISALRCISKSLRRTGVRLTPRDLRALNLNFFRNRPVFDFYRIIKV